MNILLELHDPKYVVKFQKLCGVEFQKPSTCDQQTQTHKNSYSNGEKCKTDVGGIPNDESSRSPKRSGDDDSELVNSSYTITSNTSQELRKRHEEKNNNKTSNEGMLGDAGDVKKYISGTSLVVQTDSTLNKVYTPNSSYVKIKYRSLLYLANIGAFLGNEEFYLTFFPFCCWNIDTLLVRQISMLWCLVMYMGQASKDFLMWPRPACPPVVRLETSYIQEYSMPSTHAMAGTAIPLYLAYIVVHRYQMSLWLVVPIAMTWFSVTCLSRLYLGVHSILDLVAGVIYAFLIFITFLRYVEGYDYYQQVSPFAGFFILGAALTLCTITYPSNHKSSSKGDAVQIVAAVAGNAIGCWLAYQLGYTHEPEVLPPYSLTVPSIQMVGLSLVRFVVGILIIGVAHTVVKTVSLRGFSHLYGLETPDKTHPGVQTTYKFTTYLIVGISISFFIPIIFLWLGIERSGGFYEVL